MENISESTAKVLERIAMKHSVALDNRGGLAACGNDYDDFPEVPVWGIQAMLEEAYLLGMKDAKKEAKSK